MSLQEYQNGLFKPERKVTVYHKSSMMGNIIKTEMRLIEFGTQKYAQYPSAPFCAGIQKRKRKAIKLLQRYRPFMLIVDGWDNPDSAGIYDGGQVLSHSNGVKVTQGAHTAFSVGFKNDFNNMINSHIDNGTVSVIADYREHDSTII